MGNLYKTSNFFSMRVIAALLLIFIATQAVSAAPVRKLAIPAWAKNALKASANTIVGTIIDCISQQVKSLGVAQLSKIPGVKMIANKVVGGAIDKLTAKIK